MKKIITLIMMFVLSVGFLMAQGVFTYQTVVVDNQGKLVVNKPVTATVTITDGQGHTFEQPNLTGTTSNNGLLLLSVGDKTSDAFNNMNWEVASIKVQYTVNGATVPTDTSRVAAVPYALQTDDELTTDMIVEYVKNADMDDVRAILDALDQGAPHNLKDTLLATIVDSVKENYKLAKQVFMYYVENATVADIDTLYNALVSNTQVTAALDTILVQFLKDSTEMVYDILRQYALSLTADDVNAIIAAIPPTTDNQENVKSRIVNKAFEYLMTPNAKKKLLIPVIMDYAKNAQTSDVDAMIYAIDHNPNGVKTILVNKFNSWMDAYFANHYTGGNNNSFVQTLVNDSMDARYYSCDTEVDLCQLYSDLQNMTTCFTHGDFAFEFQNVSSVGHYIGTVEYIGADPTSVTATVYKNGGLLSGVTPTVSIDYEHRKITVDILAGQLSLIPGESFNAKLSVVVTCNDNPIEVPSETYTEP